MNELILKLAEQCWDQRLDGQLHFDTEHFAFLIVQEIIEELEADVIDMNDDPTDYERGYDDGVKNSVDHIKEHFFGVEE